MTIPMATAVTAENKTAAALTSLQTLARGCSTGLTKSTTDSTAVFIASVIQTSPMAKINTEKSISLIRNNMARMTTIIVAPK